MSPFKSLNPQRAKSAFTLIELLVVIAIIGILAAILFPVFSRARENARRSACMSNMKQIGLAFLQYSQDNDEFLPKSRNNTGETTPTWRPWHYVIFPYVKNVQVFKCPNNKSTGYVTNVNSGTNPLLIPKSYNSNGSAESGWITERPWNHAEPDITPINNTTAIKLSRFSDASQTIIVGEMYDRWDPEIWFNMPQTDTRFYLSGHLQTTNLIFADGHAKTMKPTRTIVGRNMWAMRDGAGVGANLRSFLQESERLRVDNS